MKAQFVAEWERSGKTAADFAASKGFSRNSLFVWKRQLHAAASPGKRAFRPVRLPTQSSPGSQVVVRGPGGLAVAVDAQTDEAALVLALRAISRCG